MNRPETVTLAWTGASGMPYGMRLLECLLAAKVRVFLLYSSAAQIVAKQEIALTLPAQPVAAAAQLAERFGAGRDQLTVFGREDWMSPVASGSNPADAMAICPCLSSVLRVVEAAVLNTLIDRAADVM